MIKRYLESSDIPDKTPETSERWPVDVRILGDLDPRKMTREEFDQSPDILFHGSL